MAQATSTQKLARQIVRAADLDDFFASNRHRFAPETFSALKEEVDRLVKVDLTEAEPLARRARDLGWDQRDLMTGWPGVRRKPSFAPLVRSTPRQSSLGAKQSRSVIRPTPRGPSGGSCLGRPRG